MMKMQQLHMFRRRIHRLHHGYNKTGLLQLKEPMVMMLDNLLENEKRKKKKKKEEKKD